MFIFIHRFHHTMKILLVASTAFEIQPLLKKLVFSQQTNDFLQQFRIKSTLIDVLIPGVGMMVTAFQLGRQFSLEKYDLAVNAGICGSYTKVIRIGEVVEIIEDCVSELGAEDKDQFLSIYDLGLLDPYTLPYKNGKLFNSLPFSLKTLEALSKVNGITVNTVHGNKESIDRIKLLFSPQTESMEGAAFLYACLLSNVPNAQIRAVSNFVEERNRSRWNLDLALKNLNMALWDIFREVCV
jgi:futalosine hydrolase